MGMKKLAALVMALVLCMTVTSAMAATINVPADKTLEQAISEASENDIINLTGDVDLGSATIDIDNSLTINGNGYTITGTARKTFTVNNSAPSSLINVTFNNVKITNKYSSDGRCIDTRNGAFKLTIDNSTLTTTGSGNNQPLTLGGVDQTNEQTVIVRNSTINAGNAGYAIIVWVKSDITVENSELNGYAAMYFKEGSANTVANMTNNRINGVAHKGESFGAITMETKPIHINSSGNTYNVENKDNSDYAAFHDKTNEPGDNTIVSSGDKYNGNASNGVAVIQYPVAVTDLPQTGDNSSLMLWASLLALAGVGFVVSRKTRLN